MKIDESYVSSLWERAAATIEVAKQTISRHPDTAANRAYYAAFYAASALLASEGRFFKKHTGLRAAVHSDLVRTGRWPVRLGEAYDSLWQLRDVADYGVFKHVDKAEAELAIKSTEEILRAVHNERPDLFQM